MSRRQVGFPSVTSSNFRVLIAPPTPVNAPGSVRAPATVPVTATVVPAPATATYTAFRQSKVYHNDWTLPGDDRSFACMTGPESSPAATTNFIEEIINDDLAQGKNQGRVHTRFPPEPNGYLHIGHAKSICLNFGLAAKYGGKCNLRYDDTNPSTEDVEYVESIEEDVRWLGFRWNGQPLYASNYFDEIYRLTEILIENGKAYVDDLSAEQISEYRGNFYKPGQDSPFRNRAVAENLDLFRRMRAGEFADGSRVLRAKIDMRHPNLNMRDPPLYRIKKATHHRTGDKWCIYPMYDYAHPISDALEGITHSICTLEFEDHRPLYDWTIENLPLTYRPRQIEFARLNLTYTLMSKRKLLQLVEEKSGLGLERSAHAQPERPAPPRLHARGHPRLCRAHRRGQERQHRGRGPAGIRDSRGSGKARAAGHGSAAAAEGRHRQLSRWSGGVVRGSQPSRQSRDGDAQDSFLQGGVHRTRRLLPRCRPRNGSGFRPAPRFACAGPA